MIDFNICLIFLKENLWVHALYINIDCCTKEVNSILEVLINLNEINFKNKNDK